jgi:hypothetical protein
MKIHHLAVALSVVLLAGCSTTGGKKTYKPETVMVTYQVKPGSEAQFEQVLDEAWKIYERDDLVWPQPHVILRTKDADGKPKYVEILTWNDADIPDNTPPAVKTVWDKMIPLCEPRNGHGPMEGGAVDVITPVRRP